MIPVSNVAQLRELCRTNPEAAKLFRGDNPRLTRNPTAVATLNAITEKVKERCREIPPEDVVSDLATQPDWVSNVVRLTASTALAERMTREHAEMSFNLARPVYESLGFTSPWGIQESNINAIAENVKALKRLAKYPATRMYIQNKWSP